MRRRWSVRITASVVAVAGIADIATDARVRVGSPVWRLRQATDIQGIHFAPATRAVLGIALCVVARGLFRRRRPAWWIATTWAAIWFASNALAPRRPAIAAVAALVSLLLVRDRAEYSAGVDATRLRAVTVVAFAATGFALAYGLGGVATYKSHLSPRPSAGMAVREVATRLTGGAGPLTTDDSGARRWLRSLPPTGGIGLAMILLVLLAPLGDSPPDPDARIRLAGLTRTEEADSLAPFAFRSDKNYALAPNGDAGVGYRVIFGVGLAGGDPVGVPTAFDEAFLAFLDRCAHNGWVPAVIGAGQRTADQAHDLGLRSMYVGDEAIIDVESFSLDRPAMRNVRQAVNRTHNFGVTTEIMREAELRPDLRERLLGIADRWRAGVPERGFSMILDRLLTGDFPDAVLAVCFDRDHRPVAFQRYLPCLGGKGLTLDTMRRENTAPNGTNERMIVDVVEWSRAHGIDEVSLNFAAFRTLLAEERGILRSVEYWMVHRLDRFIKVESLYRFNAKFCPSWRPRYVLFRSTTDLAWILPAALVAEFGGDQSARNARRSRGAAPLA